MVYRCGLVAREPIAESWHFEKVMAAVRFISVCWRAGEVCFVVMRGVANGHNTDVRKQSIVLKNLLQCQLHYGYDKGIVHQDVLP